MLPVAILAGVGLWTLRRDRAYVEDEAKQLAKRASEEAAERLQTSFGGLLANQQMSGTKDEILSALERGPHSIAVDGKGELISPKPFSKVPNLVMEPFRGLSHAQRQFWERAEALEYQQGNIDESEKAYRKFLTLNPSTNWMARAHFALGVLLIKRGNTNAGLSELRLARETATSATLMESGLPLRHVAALRMLELCVSGARTEVALDFDASAVLLEASYEPSPLSPQLMELADKVGVRLKLGGTGVQSQSWAAVWQITQQQRALYQSLFAGRTAKEFLDAFSWNGAPVSLGVEQAVTSWFWGGADSNVFVQGTALLGTIQLKTIEIGTLIQQTLSGMSSVPPYLKLAVQVEGKPVILPPSTTRPFGVTVLTITPSYPNPATLLHSSRWEGMAGYPSLAIDAYLASPEELYRGVEGRRVAFLSLIALSVLAALIGFETARRAFYRQLRLSELKTNFVSSVSHELRAPIASLRLMAERLESGRVQDEPKQKEYFHFIVQECRRLGSMIENVLDFSRIERGQKRYDFESTDLVALMDNCIKLMEPSAAEREIRLKKVIKGEPLAVQVDGLALQQAVLNLMDNAIKHSPNGSEVQAGVEFIERAAEEEPMRDGNGAASVAGPEQNGDETQRRGGRKVFEGNLKLWVLDHGEGIPKAEHEKIFERFYRCGSELRRTTQGVGIGLSIVAHVVEAHGGRVTVESDVGKGSRFTIELPVEHGKTLIGNQPEPRT